MTSNSLRAVAFRGRPGSDVSSAKPYVLKFYRQVVDAPCRRRNPTGKSSWFDYAAPHLTHEGMVIVRREPGACVPFPLILRKDVSGRAHIISGKTSDLAME